ncbi:hypothetical protein C2U70_06290 [Bradyrhizobium guangdongense]|nr:hypothetical protein C2U70_06290 [Bradyrhizobium guangdongense]
MSICVQMHHYRVFPTKLIRRVGIHKVPLLATQPEANIKYLTDHGVAASELGNFNAREECIVWKISGWLSRLIATTQPTHLLNQTNSGDHNILGVAGQTIQRIDTALHVL